MDSPDLIKKKKKQQIEKNEDDKCFEYEVTAASNYAETESHPERV